MKINSAFYLKFNIEYHLIIMEPCLTSILSNIFLRNECKIPEIREYLTLYNTGTYSVIISCYRLLQSAYL